MADIAMCSDKTCPSRGRCHRYCAWPSGWQWQSAFDRNGDDVCEHFEPRRDDDRTLMQADAGVMALKKGVA